MGSGVGSLWHWLIVLLVVVLLFGTKKLRDLGTDLGSAIKSFRASMKEGEEQAAQEESASRPAAPAQLGGTPGPAEGGQVGEGQAAPRESPKV